MVVTSDQSIVEVFQTYAVFERGSGNGRTDPPVNLSWTSDRLKVLGGIIGPEDVEEDNWRPRIVAVENVLQSWKAPSR